MKYNYWTNIERSVLRLEVAKGRTLNLQEPSPGLARILRRHSKMCVRQIACRLRKERQAGQEVAE